MSDDWEDVEIHDPREIIPGVFPGARVTSTSRDRNHPLSKKNPNSPHIDNPNAFDVAPIPGMTFEGFMKGLRDQGYEVDGIDEVKRPSGHATGPHWHGVIRKGPADGGWEDVPVEAPQGTVVADGKGGRFDIDPLAGAAATGFPADDGTEAPAALMSKEASIGKQWGLDPDTLKSLGFKGDEGFLDRPLALDLVARAFEGMGYASNKAAQLADYLSEESGLAEAMSWDGNKFLPGTAMMALAEAFPLGGMEMGGFKPGIPRAEVKQADGTVSRIFEDESAGGIKGGVTDDSPGLEVRVTDDRPPHEVARQQLEEHMAKPRTPEEEAAVQDTIRSEAERWNVDPAKAMDESDFRAEVKASLMQKGIDQTALERPAHVSEAAKTGEDIIKANPEADALLAQEDGVTSYVLQRPGEPAQIMGKTENLRRELLKEANNQGKYDELYDLIMDPKDNNFQEAAEALGMKYDHGRHDRIFPEYGSKNGEGLEPGSVLHPRQDVPEIDKLRNEYGNKSVDARPVRSLAEERAVVEANPDGNKTVKTPFGELTEFASHADDRFLTFTGKNGDVASIHVNIGKNGKAEISVDPFSHETNRFGAVAIRQAQKALKDMYPEIDTVYGNRISGAKPGRDQELRLREEGQEGYDPQAVGTDELIERLTAAIKGAKSLNKEQLKLYTEARREKVAKMIQARQTPGYEGYKAERAALKGEMPKVNFEPVDNLFAPEEVARLFDMIKGSNQLHGAFEPFNAQTGLAKLLSGQVPTASELALLSKILPDDFVKAAMGHRMFGAKANSFLGNALNLPRSLMSTLDLSAPFRQGIFMVSRPEFWRAFTKMFKMYGDEKAYQAVIDQIKERPTFQLMEENNLALSDLASDLTKREEEFMSEWAEKIPVAGRAVRASSRAYTGFLNKLRADVFDSILAKAPELANDPQGMQALAKYINNATGRGDLGVKGNQAAPLLAAGLFSPRLMASRVNMLTQVLQPSFYTKTPKVIRKEYLRDLLGFGAIATTVVGLAKLMGSDVETDARSSDFGKIKVGNTRYDMLGGFGQYLTLAARLGRNSTKNAKGVVKELGPDAKGYKNDSRLDVLGRFGRTKFSPNASYIANYLDGENVVGDRFKGNPLDTENTSYGPIDWKSDTAKLFIPMVLQDLDELTEEHGVVQGTPMTVPGVFGFGSQTYDPNKPRKKEAAPAPVIVDTTEPIPTIPDDGEWETIK